MREVEQKIEGEQTLGGGGGQEGLRGGPEDQRVQQARDTAAAHEGAAQAMAGGGEGLGPLQPATGVARQRTGGERRALRAPALAPRRALSPSFRAPGASRRLAATRAGAAVAAAVPGASAAWASSTAAVALCVCTVR